MYLEIKNTQQLIKSAVDGILQTITQSDVDRIRELLQLFNHEGHSLRLSIPEQGALKRNILHKLTEQVIKEEYPGLISKFRKGQLLPPKFELKIELKLEERFSPDLDELLSRIAKTTVAIDKINYHLTVAGLDRLGEQLLTDREQTIRLLFPDIDKRKVQLLEKMAKIMRELRDRVSYDSEVEEIFFALREDKNLFQQYLKLK